MIYSLATSITVEKPRASCKEAVSAFESLRAPHNNGQFVLGHLDTFTTLQ